MPSRVHGGRAVLGNDCLWALAAQTLAFLPGRFAFVVSVVFHATQLALGGRMYMQREKKK
jgi:hypothetical protein